MIRSLFLIFVLAGIAAPAAAAGEPILTVPFLPQTEALCGGAATAMVYRFWGDRHADVQQFAPLVDRRAGGIRDVTLVAAIRAQGWHAEPRAGSLDLLRATLANGRPPILLIEDRPSRYHFVVGVGLTDRDVVVHDPTWGPARRLPIARFTRAWNAAGWWMLIITPQAAPRELATPITPPTVVAASTSVCDRLLDGALDDIERKGLAAADAALAPVLEQCPASAGPLRELGGVRLAQRRYADAAMLSRQALQLAADDGYARDVLASSLFLQNDVTGAVREWNLVGKPKLDRVDIVGLTRARYALIARITGLQPNTLLTPAQFSLATRALEQLPDRVASNVTLRPDGDGFATATAAIQETSRLPRGAVEWAAAGIQTAVNRELVTMLAGWSGQGELWSASWRWWENRPRVAASFAAPLTGRWPGVWRVEAAWERQHYAAATTRLREERRTGVVSVRNWFRPNTRYELRTGLDAWNSNRHAIVAGGTLEQRLFGERISIVGAADRWFTMGDAAAFSNASALVTVRSRRDTRGIVLTGLVRADAASAAAPLALWSGAGEGRGRPGLLRAHRMLDEGVIDAPVFGRRSASTNIELQRWSLMPLVAIGVAGFLDAAIAADRLVGTERDPFLLDAGIGLRARMPGRPGTFRIDYAHGIRDGAHRISAGWDVGAR